VGLCCGIWFWLSGLLKRVSWVLLCWFIIFFFFSLVLVFKVSCKFPVCCLCICLRLFDLLYQIVSKILEFQNCFVVLRRLSKASSFLLPLFFVVSLCRLVCLIRLVKLLVLCQRRTLFVIISVFWKSVETVICIGFYLLRYKRLWPSII